MIARIDVLLCRWGRWAVSQARREVGYPSISPMFRDSRLGRGYGSEVPAGVSDGDMDAIDRAINALPAVLRVVVVCHYQRQGAMRATAVSCGISHRSVSQYINQAHGLIAQHLDYESVGG